MKLFNIEKERSFEDDIAYLRHKLITELEIPEEWFNNYTSSQSDEVKNMKDIDYVIKKQLNDYGIDEKWLKDSVNEIINEEKNMELHNINVETFKSKYPDIYIEVDHFNKCVNFKKNISGLTEHEKLRVKVGFDLQIEQVGSNTGTFVMDCINVAKTYMTENTSPSKTLLYD